MLQALCLLLLRTAALHRPSARLVRVLLRNLRDGHVLPPAQHLRGEWGLQELQLLPDVLERPSVLFSCPSCTGQRQGVLFHELLKHLCYYTVPWDECKGLLPNELQSPVVTFINNTWLSSGSLIMSMKKLKIQIPFSFSAPHKFYFSINHLL